MTAALADSQATWRIAFGHHPYLSNGRHGNAGNDEGLLFVPVANGDGVETFMEDHVCGHIDLYLCGHDHNRHWLDPTCGTEFIVSGAAAKTTDLENRDGNPTIWEDDQSEGFAWVRWRHDDGGVLRAPRPCSTPARSRNRSTGARQCATAHLRRSEVQTSR